MHHASEILLTLFIIFIAAQLGAEVAQRLKLPAVVGEIAAGCVVGPSMLGWLTPGQILPGTPLDVLAEIGVVVLLFSVGLETRLDDLKKVGKSAFLVGVLQELGVLQQTESRVILGAAVIDDILAMLLLGVVSSLQGGGSLNLQSLMLTLGGAIGFVAIVGWGGTRVMRSKSGWLEAPISPHSALTLVLALCLGLAWLSTRFGLAAIIGAFLAGMIASETRQRDELEHQTLPLLAFLTPFFFVVTGAKINMAELASAQALWTLAVVTLT